MEAVIVTRATRKGVVTAVAAVAAAEAANDGFWPASLFHGKAVYRVYCHLASGAGRNSIKTSLLYTCNGLAVLRKLNLISGSL